MFDGLFDSATDCGKQLEKFVKSLDNRDKWALNFFDTWGLQTGSLHNRRYNFGLFKDCVNYRYEDIEGKYCKIGVKALESTHPANESFLFGNIIHDMLFVNDVSLIDGICMPKACSHGDVKKFTDAFFGLNHYEARVFRCFDPPKFEAIDGFAIFVFVSIILLSVVSSAYDVITKLNGHEPRKSLTIFSFPRNFAELMKINKTESSINCIDGMKVLAAITIIIGHRSDFMGMPWPKHWMGIFVRNAIGMYQSSVDTFLVCSAFLITQSLLRAMRNLESFNLTKIYVTRYLRYLPAVAVLVIFFASSLPYWIIDGPRADDLDSRLWKCRKWWWSSLLFIQNQVNEHETCHNHTWYLSVDFQLFLITPLIVYGLMRSDRKGCYYVVLTIVALQAYMFYGRLSKTATLSQFYYNAKYRSAEYLVGVLAGYLMFDCKRKMRLSKAVVIGGWSLTLLFFWSHGFYNIKRFMPNTGRQFYDSVSREAWACSICWIIFACHYLESGGFIRRFLSHQFWQPYSKTCLSIYLVHYLYILLTNTDDKEPHRVAIWWQIHIHVGDVVLSILFGMIFYLLVEAPTNQAVRTFMFKGPKKNAQETCELAFETLNESK